MLSRRLFVPFIVAILTSCTAALDVPTPASGGSGVESTERAHEGLVATGPDGAIWLVRSGSRTLERWDEGSASPAIRIDLPIAPRALRSAPKGGVVAVGVAGTTPVDTTGVVGTVRAGLDAAGDERLDSRAGRLTLSRDEKEVAIDFPRRAIREARLLGDGRAAVLASDGDGDSLFVMTPAGVNRVAGPFASLDSFDVSPDGSEIAFSARREAGFDIGLVAAEGSEVRWIGPDPLDERRVKWAPRGNKVAYVIETSGGSLVRSVHIPTGFQVGTSLPQTEVRDFAWDPAGERLAILMTSSNAGERVEVIRYDGSERRGAIPAIAQSEMPDQLAGVPEAVVFPPEHVRYNERLPLVIWATREGAFAWNEARARVQQNRRIGSVVVARGVAARPALWKAIGALPWVDPSQVYLVARDAEPDPGEAVAAGLHVTLVTEEERPSGSSARVTVVSSGSRPLEEFAVSWLSERLRGFEREHDGS